MLQYISFSGLNAKSSLYNSNSSQQIPTKDPTEEIHENCIFDQFWITFSNYNSNFTYSTKFQQRIRPWRIQFLLKMEHTAFFLLGCLFALLLHVSAEEDAMQPKARHFTVPMAEIMQHSLYISANADGELQIRHASRGSDLKEGDYLAEAGGTRLLNGGLDTFLSSGEKEVIVPVVDDTDQQHGGMRLLGFVQMQSVIPRSIGARRGEVDSLWDMEEGGAAPTMHIGNIMISGKGAVLTEDRDYVPVPMGGGKCITGRDCFWNNGTCTGGHCHCEHSSTGMTGTYCQLFRPDKSKATEMAAFRQTRLLAEKEKQKAANPTASVAAWKSNTEPTLGEADSSINDSSEAALREDKDKPRLDSKPVKKKTKKVLKTKVKPKPAPEPTDINEVTGATSASATESQAERFIRERALREQEAQAMRGGNGVPVNGVVSRAVVDRANEAGLEESSASTAAGEVEMKRTPSVDSNPATKAPSSPSTVPAAPVAQKEATVEDLYGNGKAYPEPYTAGKVPSELVHVRHKARAEKRAFIYSVRYRSGPLGLTFDNINVNSTIVERVGKGLQSEASDVQAGDVVIAIDQYNTTLASAKISQRIMASLSFPRIVTFQVKGSMVDTEKIARDEARRTLNLAIVYPPTLQQEWNARLADWSTLPDNPDYVREYVQGSKNTGNLGGTYRKDTCTVYMMRAAADQFGCDRVKNQYDLPSRMVNILERRGDLNIIRPAADGSNEKFDAKEKMDLERDYPMLLMLAREAEQRGVHFNIQSVALMRRGICTFVQKSDGLDKSGAKMGVIVNTEEGDKLGSDLPAGKENTSNCKVPVAMANFTDLDLVYTHAGDRGGVQATRLGTIPEVYAISVGEDQSSSCNKMQSIFEDIMDAWPHSFPHFSVNEILYPNSPPGTEGDNDIVGNSLQAREPFKQRKTIDEGGRLAVSGDNGWAFFDYHLANFGPQTEDLPLTPMRLVMALPAFGCDPNAYTNRITGSVVAILRGGGCSFGIKVINAQKLGALAVLIVNTDDAKTMRLMALPDEIPQIQIPCLMASRRLQFFMQNQLKKYYQLNQHIISIHPTGLFGMYEERNTVSLPERLDVPSPPKGQSPPKGRK